MQRELLLLRDPYEVCETICKAMEPRIIQVGELKFIMVSNPLMESGTIRMSCGPEPEQNVWVTGLAGDGEVAR